MKQTELNQAQLQQVAGGVAMCTGGGYSSDGEVYIYESGGGGGGYVFVGDAPREASWTDYLVGALRTVTGAIGTSTTSETTPTATLGIRG